MEEITNKLSSKRSVVITQAISRLLQNIKGKPNTDILETPEFKFLKEKCVSSDRGLSAIASDAILHVMVQVNSLLVKPIIADFVSVITTTKCSPNVAFLINKLLLKDIENELSESNQYKCPFNLKLPQHPFLILLNENSDSWTCIYKEIEYSRKTLDDNALIHYNQMLKPIFLYTVCHPRPGNLTNFKQRLWSYIIHHAHQDTINCLLSWTLFENVDTIEINSGLLNELCCSNTNSTLNKNILLLWQISVLYQLILYDFDPRATMLSARDLVERNDETVVLNSALLILAKCIPLCSSVYLLQLLHLCKTVIQNTKSHSVVKQTVRSSLLQWIGNPSSLAAEAIALANKIFLSLENQEDENIRNQGYGHFFKENEKLITTNSEVYNALQTCVQLEKWTTNKDVLNWLNKLEKAPTFFTQKVIYFLFGLFLSEFTDVNINLRVFRLILKCVDYNRILASDVLTLILYKLTNTDDSELHYQLLKGIPKMAIAKDNFQKIVNAIQALNKGENVLKTFSTILMLDLWKLEYKCYPYLEKFLITPCSQCDLWESSVTKAYILKELCALKPELYGKDIVAHLSKILNECRGTDRALPCALAIDGITLLCKSEIIDVVTTWATLAPMFNNENRIPVIKSLCSLVSSISSLPYTEAYPTLTEDVLTQLWKYTTLNQADEVWKAALNAMTYFTVEQIVASTPEHYFDDEILSIRKSGHVVPGQCWVQFLSNCDKSRLQTAADFLIKLVSLEISSYLKFVYQVKGTREPVDYSYLPVNSVVRGVSLYIKSKMLKWKDEAFKEVYLQCLRIFSQEYSKPLPPMDWCFLQEFVHEPEAKNVCINIASHQVILSGTARRFIVNYVEAVIQNHTSENDVLNIYTNLKYLGNSVQPFTLKPFLQVTICYAVDLFGNGNKAQLMSILQHLQETLRDQEIQESNKVVIAQIINDIICEAEIYSEIFEALIGCVILFPVHCINDISSHKAVKEVRTEWLKKAIKIRCHLAVSNNEAPLNWINDILEIGSSFPLITTFIFEQFAIVFEKQKDNTECVLWLLELVGQIQAKTAEKSQKTEIVFLCNVFILAVIVFSGHLVLLKDFSHHKELYRVFPRAIATLLEVNHWSICTTQVLEWFYHMNTEKIFYDEYGDMFVQSLQTLRHETESHKNMRWIKYLNVAC